MAVRNTLGHVRNGSPSVGSVPDGVDRNEHALVKSAGPDRGTPPLLAVALGTVAGSALTSYSG